MGKIMLNEIDYSGGNANIIRLTQAEYDALPPSKLTDNNVYMITDVNGDGSQFQPVIYSEDEREIGVWIDGKPLYQKTYTNVSLQNNSDATLETNVSEFEIKDFEIDFIGVSDTVVKLRNCDDSLYVNNSGSLIYWINASSWYVGLSVANITVKYTKTTDAVGSGTWTPQGIPAVHYSTDEKVIGTWIDGSTLYEKTLVYDVTSTISSNTVLGTITSAEKMFLVSAVAYNSDDNRGLILPFTSGSVKNSISFNNGVVTLILEKDSYSSVWTFYITIQYTKTSQGGN